MFVHTSHGRGHVVEEQTVRGRKSFLVEGSGFKVWVDEKDMRVANQFGGGDHVNEDNSTTLPYDPSPQHPAEMFNSYSTIQPGDYEIDADERLSPTDSVSFNGSEGDSYPGPSADNFAKQAFGPPQGMGDGRHGIPFPPRDPGDYEGRHRRPPAPEMDLGDGELVWDSRDWDEVNPEEEFEDPREQERFNLWKDKYIGHGELNDRMLNTYEPIYAYRTAGDLPEEFEHEEEAPEIQHFSNRNFYGGALGLAEEAIGEMGGFAGMADKAVDAVDKVTGGGEPKPKRPGGKDLNDLNDKAKKHLGPIEELADEFAGPQVKKNVGGVWPGRPDSQTVTASYRPAGLSDKYIRIAGHSDHYSDPVQQFRDDPVSFIQKRAYMHEGSADIRLAEYVDLVDSDPHIRTAAWKDVRAKALRLRRDGRVHVKDISPTRIYAAVDGDNDTYETMIVKSATNQSIDHWTCDCGWGSTVGQRKVSYVGRLCFLPGTPIVMADGTLKPIEEIVEGDLVRSHTGEARKVTSTILNHHNDAVYGVHPRGHETIWATGNHPFYVRPHTDIKCQDCWDKGYQRSQCAAQGTKGHDHKNAMGEKFNPQWVEAASLTTNHWMSKTAPKMAERTIVFDLTEFCENYRQDDQGRILRGMATPQTGMRYRGNPVDRYVKLDEDLAYLFGLYLGDGSHPRSGTVGFHFGLGEQHLVDEVVRISGEKFSLSPQVHVGRSGRNIIDVFLTSAIVTEFFHKYAGNGHATKKLSSEILEAPASVLAHALRGWIDSDNACSVNRNLVFQMEQIALRNSISCSVTTTSAERQGNSLVGHSTRDIYHLNCSPERDQNSQFFTNFVEGDTAWVRISEISEKHYHGPVFNLSVEGEETYQVNGFNVHNCSHGYAAFLEMESQQMKDPKKFRRSAGVVEDFKEWAKNENHGKIDEASLANFIYLCNSMEEGEQAYIGQEQAQQLYDSLSDNKTQGKVRNFDVGYELDPEKHYKEADVLHLRPRSLTPDMSFIEDEDGQEWVDVTKDERKTTGPDNMVKKSRRLTAAEIRYASDEELGERIKGWDGAGSDLNKLRGLSAEGPDFQNMRDRNEEVRNVIDELHDRGIDASQFVAALRMAADDSSSDSDTEPDDDKKKPPASTQGQPSMSGSPSQTGQPGGSSSITKPENPSSAPATPSPKNQAESVGFGGGPAASAGSPSPNAPANTPQMDAASALSSMGQAAGGVGMMLPNLINSIGPQVVRGIGNLGTGIGSGISSITNALSGLGGLLHHAENITGSYHYAAYPNIQLTNQEAFAGSGPDPKYWFGDSQDYVDEHERPHMVDVTDLDDDELIRDNKGKPGQGPRKASRRPLASEEAKNNLLQAEGEELEAIGLYRQMADEARGSGDNGAVGAFEEALHDEQDHAHNFSEAIKHASENANPEGSTVTSGDGYNDTNATPFDQVFKAGAFHPTKAWDGHRIRDFKKFVKQQGGQMPNHQILQEYLKKPHRNLDQGGTQHLQDYTAYSEQHEASRRYAEDELIGMAGADVPGISDQVPADSDTHGILASYDDGSDIVAQFHRMGGIEAINNSGGGGTYSDSSIAERAQGFLRTAGRHFSLSEQRELEEESHPKGARNLKDLKLEGTHYEDV